MTVRWSSEAAADFAAIVKVHPACDVKLMDLGFLLSLIVFLGGLWVYLFRPIRQIIAGDSAALFLGYLHFTVLTYLGLALYVFYRRGLGETIEMGGSGLNVSAAIIVTTWPLVLLCAGVSFLLVKASSSDFAVKFYMLILSVAAFVGAIYQGIHQRHSGHAIQLSPTLIFIFFFGIALGGIAYMLLLSFFLADVEVTTDKEFYTDTECVILSAQAGGYIFRPSITGVVFGGYRNTFSGNQTLVIRPEIHNGNDLVVVEYEPQVFTKKRKAYHYVKMARVDPNRFSLPPAPESDAPGPQPKSASQPRRD